MSMNGFNSQYFNRNLLNSLKDTLRGMVTEAESPQKRAMLDRASGIRAARLAKIDARKAELKTPEGQAELKRQRDAENDRQRAANSPQGRQERVNRMRELAKSAEDMKTANAAEKAVIDADPIIQKQRREADARAAARWDADHAGREDKPYVNPNSPEGRIAAQNAAEYASGSGPGRAVDDQRDSSGRPKNMETARADVRRDSAKVEAEMRAEDARKNGPPKNVAPGSELPSKNPQTPTAPTAKPQAPVRAGGAAPATSIWQSSYMDDQKAPPAQTTGTPPDPNGLYFGSQDKGRRPDMGKPLTQEQASQRAIQAQELHQFNKPGGVTIPATVAPAAKPQAPVSIPAAEQRLNDNAVDIYTTARMKQLQVDNAKERKTESDRSFNAAQDRVAAKPQTVGAVPGTPSLASMNRAAAVATVGMPTSPAAPTPPRESVNGRTYDALTDLQLQNIVRNTKTTKFGGEVLDDSKQKQTFIQARDELARRAKK